VRLVAAGQAIVRLFSLRKSIDALLDRLLTVGLK
jgi:hypothetical protein